MREPLFLDRAPQFTCKVTEKLTFGLCLARRVYLRCAMYTCLVIRLIFMQFRDLILIRLYSFSAPQQYLRTCMAQMEMVFEQQLKQQRLMPSYLLSITAQTTNNHSANPAANTSSNTSHTTTTQHQPSPDTSPTGSTTSSLVSKSQSGTPTDVQDVDF